MAEINEPEEQGPCSECGQLPGCEEQSVIRGGALIRTEHELVAARSEIGRLQLLIANMMKDSHKEPDSDSNS